MKFKIGDIVNSNWNTYGGVKEPCVVDRIYQRKNETSKMLRLRRIKNLDKTINVPEWSCVLDILYSRNDKLTQLGL